MNATRSTGDGEVSAPRRRDKDGAQRRSRGLGAVEQGIGPAPASVEALRRAIEQDGGAVLAVYRDPIGGRWQLLAALPIECVAPTPFQRDLSEAHRVRLADVIDRMDRFLDPITVVRVSEKTYWTPNGRHRLAAVDHLGGRSITALVLPEPELAYRILALNTEKAHNLREKSLEVIRMARSLADLGPKSEQDFALEFEEAAFLTLGLSYEARPRFPGGAFHTILRRVDAFLERPLAEAFDVRRARAARLLELDDRVSELAAALKERGFESPYLKAFVVARLNPLRFRRGATTPTFDGTLEKMLAAAAKFDASRVRPEHLAGAGGGAEE